MAINAANDSNTDEDRATIQKEFIQRMDTINDIATTTAYNGKTLLDGTHAKDISMVIPPSSTTTANSNATSSTTTVNSNAAASTQPLNTAKIIDEPTIINAGDFTITEDGIYSLAEDYTGTITIDAQNVKLTQETPATQLENVSIVTRAEGSSNLWIENLNIKNTEDKNIIKFQGADNYLTVKGTNTFVKRSGDCAAINVGDALTIIGDGTLNIQTNYTGAAIIGSDRSGTAGDITIADNVTITATINSTSSSAAAIGSGVAGHIGNIKIGGNATVTATAAYGAAIGSGVGSSGNWVYATAGDIEIGDNATVTAKAGTGAAIGSGENISRVGNITIGGNANVTATSTNSAIGEGGSARQIYTSAGNITISSTATVTLQTSFGNPTITSYNSTISNGETSFEVNVNETVNTQQVEPGVTIISLVDFSKALKIQSGDSANQSMNIFIADMHTKSLGAGKLFDGAKPINSNDKARYEALNYDRTKQIEWLTTLRAAENLTLDDISVTTRENANIAIRVLDGALEYALDQATTIGAYLQRLEHTATNITTSTENVQAAESTIRDADMAKEMTDYTKFNILTQASQSMLAQANQNATAALGLLK